MLLLKEGHLHAGCPSFILFFLNYKVCHGMEGVLIFATAIVIVFLCVYRPMYLLNSDVIGVSRLWF